MTGVAVAAGRRALYDGRGRSDIDRAVSCRTPSGGEGAPVLPCILQTGCPTVEDPVRDPEAAKLER